MRAHIFCFLLISSALVNADNNETTKEKLDLRLPTAIQPLHYLLKIQPFINSNFSIHGHVEVLVTVTEQTDRLTMHMQDIETLNHTAKMVPLVKSNDDKTVGIMSLKYDDERTFLIVHFNQNLTVGQKYLFSINYVGTVNDHLKGFYRSTYEDANGVVKRVASTQFQAIDARRAFPCFDEPAMKARFTVHLARETNMTSLSNMPIMSSVQMPDNPGWVWDTFDTSVPMSTYLLAFVVSDFAYVNSTQSEDLLFRVWARPEAINQTKYANDVGVKILRYFEDYFNISYPLPKMDMIAIPEFAYGAMENWGLITYRDTAMLYEEGQSTAASKQVVCSIVSHELSHQWFGNLVTMKWWNDLWLNEGFAAYVTEIGVDHAEPTWDKIGQFVVQKHHQALRDDSLDSSHPISTPIHHPDDTLGLNPVIYYQKGAAVIRMMNHFLTEPTLRNGLFNYLNYFKYENAEQDDLWHYLTMQGHREKTLPEDMTVKEVMDTWTLQTGYPVISVERDDNGSALITQKRFLMNPNNNSMSDEAWWIPLTWTSRNNMNFGSTKPNRWVSTKMKEFILSGLPPKSDWIIFNVQQNAFYRINYDMDNWLAIADQLVLNHKIIHNLNRAQIIDDSFQLAKAGQLGYNIPLELIAYLKEEKEMIPWNAAFNNLYDLNSRLITTPIYGAFKMFALSLVIPLYESVGLLDKETDSHNDKMIRSSVVQFVCSSGYKPCVKLAVELYDQWMQQPSNSSIINSSIRSAVYCTAIEKGGIEEWEFAWDRYMESNIASEKSILMKALGCSKDIWILSRYLNRSFTKGSGIKLQNVGRPISSVSWNPVGRHLSWDYVRDNWNTINEFVPKGFRTLSSIVKLGTGTLSTEHDKNEVNAFVARSAVKEALKPRDINNVIERVTANIKWMDSNYKTIALWLENHNKML